MHDYLSNNDIAISFELLIYCILKRLFASILAFLEVFLKVFKIGCSI